MNRDVRIRDGRLFQILIHTAATAHVPTFELNGHPRSTLQFSNPFDAVVREVLISFFAGRNVFAFPFAVDDFGLVALRIDLNLEVVRRLPGRYFRNDLDGLAGRQHAVHAGGADADALLPTAHAQPVEFGSVEQ